MSSLSSGVDRLLSPRYGPGVCPHCLNLVAADGLCRACCANQRHLAAVVPISYSVGGEWLHHLIASYKRDADPSVPAALLTLARLCEEFIADHERCVAAACGVPEFQLVCTVPSGDRLRDRHHPLRRIVGEMVASTSERHQRLLLRSCAPAIPRLFDPARYRATRRLDGEAVLLIDDMWTSGASAEAAAATLIDAGAGTVAAVVIARHLNRHWHENNLRISRLARAGFDGAHCAICAPSIPLRKKPAAALPGGGGLTSDC